MGQDLRGDVPRWAADQAGQGQRSVNLEVGPGRPPHGGINVDPGNGEKPGGEPFGQGCGKGSHEPSLLFGQSRGYERSQAVVRRRAANRRVQHTTESPGMAATVADAARVGDAI